MENNGLQLNKPRKKVSLDARKARSGYAFVALFIVGIVLVYLPIFIDSILFSFSYYNTAHHFENGMPVSKYEWVNFENYKAAFSNEQFTVKVLAGLQALIFEVPAVIIFSLFIAVVLNQKMIGRAAFRAIFFVPVIISTGLMETINAADIMSQEMEGGIEDGTDSSGGSQIISALDVEALFGQMKVGAELVMYVVQIVNQVYDIINYSGVQMLIFLAGLQSISPAIYEACQIEGATGWETFWKITFPMISPMILVNAVYSVINAFTRSTNPMMKFLSTQYKASPYMSTAMSWMYFLVVILIIAAVAGIVSSFIFYQRKD